MKRTCIIVLTALSIFALSSCEESQQQIQTQVDLISKYSSFKFPGSSYISLTNQNPSKELSPIKDSTFTLKFTVNTKEVREEKTILDIPEILTVVLRNHDPNDRKQQNYPAYKMPDGTVPVLEAGLLLQLPVENNRIRKMPVGIPLAMLNNPYGEHEIILNFTGVQWTMYVDGKLADNEFALGYPVWEKATTWKIDPEYVVNAEIYSPFIQPERVIPEKPDVAQEIQSWTPEGHNAWVGDVATLYKDGRYHVFYLYDRRNHNSKFGRGAHYFEHISTIDYKTWTEHEAATPIEEQWETFGTGTPFVFDGKLCISYGLHTTRIYPAAETTLPDQWNYYRTHGRTGSINIDTIASHPAGSTYSISSDGITNFRKTNILFHPCENPSVYTDPEGNLRMLANFGAKGTWGSNAVDGGWYSIDSVFPPGGDCTFFFRWGDYDYIIGGFTGLWSKKVSSKDSEYSSIVKTGLDFYNGMCVPAISEISDNRFLMAGWIQLLGWGGTLNIHELVQLGNGVIGTKWMEEIIPQTGKSESLSKKITEQTAFDIGYPSFMLTFDVQPLKDSDNKLSVDFLPGSGDNYACELQITPNEKRAQYGPGSTTGFAEKEKSLREGGHPQSARNYAIENLVGTDKPFTVRLTIKSSDKFGGSLIDTEIAGKRTLISYRSKLVTEKLLFNTQNIEIKNVKIAPLLY